MFFNTNEHKKIDNNMIDTAKTYISQNINKFSQEVYIDAGKMGFILPNNCSSLSGVLYDGEQIIPYLSCSEYESDLESNEKNKDYIKLNGSGIVVLLKGMEYEEPGYTTNGNVKIYGSVGNEAGVYTIYYNDVLSDTIVQRKIIVIDNATLVNLYPKITINGPKTQYVIVNSEYDESNITANDELEGDLTAKIKRLGKLDSNVIGDYNISYVVLNSRGYRTYASRTVKVVDHIIDLQIDSNLTPTKKTMEDVTINLSVKGNYFNRIEFPDGTTSNNKQSSYVVTANGTYKFVAYDSYGMSVEKEVEVNNIDKGMPTGQCRTILYGNRSKTIVNITSSRSIESYEYILDGVSSGLLKSSTYEGNIKPSKASVKVVDALNSESEIECSLDQPQIYTDSSGKNCLDGYNCYIQFNYTSTKYPYCSTVQEKSCGTISSNGCSITSVAIAISGFGIRSKSGDIYNPYTVWNELYQINKSTGYCDAACSSWTRIKGAIRNAGLSPADKVKALNRDADNQQLLINHLKKGYPAIVHARSGAYTKGGHYMAIIGVRESDNYVFLTDPATWSGTYKSTYNNKKYYTDTYVPIDDLIKGLVDEYLLVGPSGYTW